MKNETLNVSTDLNNLDKIDEALRFAASGKPRMDLLMRGRKIADELGDFDSQMHYRLEYMREAVIYDDDTILYVVFPELISLNDRHEAEHGSSPYTRKVLWRYKWVIDGTEDFYRISLKQFEAFCEDYKKRCLRAGYSLRSYYQKRFSVYSLIDSKISAESYDAFLREKPDGLSDCEACERNSQIRYQMRMGNFEEAERLAQDIFSGHLTCTRVPAATYGTYVRTYNLLRCRGKEREEISLKKVSDYCQKLRDIVEREKVCEDYLGDMLLFYALTNPPKALPFFRKHWEYFEENLNPFNRFYFACGAARFFGGLASEPTYRMRLPQSFPLYKEDGVYDTAELKKYYQDYAKDCAAKFDARNGNTYIGDIYVSLTGDSSC